MRKKEKKRTKCKKARIRFEKKREKSLGKKSKLVYIILQHPPCASSLTSIGIVSVESVVKLAN